MEARKKIAVFIIFSLTGILLVSFFRPTRINSEFQIKHYWTYKTHNTEKFDFVFYGDSRVGSDLSPHAVLEGSEYSGFNFAYTSGGMTNILFDFIENHLATSRLYRGSGRSHWQTPVYHC